MILSVVVIKRHRFVTFVMSADTTEGNSYTAQGPPPLLMLVHLRRNHHDDAEKVLAIDEFEALRSMNALQVRSLET